MSSEARCPKEILDACSGIALLYADDFSDEYCVRLRAAMEADNREEMEHIAAVMVALMYSRGNESARFASEKWSEVFGNPSAAAPASPTTDPLQPELSLLVKLGSIAVHAEEMIEPGRHQFDIAAIKTLLDDEEVKQWIKNMGVYMPVKR